VPRQLFRCLLLLCRIDFVYFLLLLNFSICLVSLVSLLHPMSISHLLDMMVCLLTVGRSAIGLTIWDIRPETSTHTSGRTIVSDSNLESCSGI